jgi:hypothetical protein
MSRRATILIGGRRRDSATFWQRINKKAKAIKSALRPKKKKQLKPGEERQLLLPGFERDEPKTKEKHNANNLRQMRT